MGSPPADRPAPRRAIDRVGYLAAYNLLISDFRHLWAYVEPTDANLPTYSHRLYELLLRACTEVESMCKDLLLVHGLPKGDDMRAYRALAKPLNLGGLAVRLEFWNPTARLVTPFSTWATAAPPWYKAYNAVKHSRLANFKEASLENVADAVAAVMAFLTIGVLGTGLHSGVNNMKYPLGKVPGNYFQIDLNDGYYPFGVYEPH